ncbi:MAG: zinc-ribbon and DUF3426 domain-containing protein [Burkholderiales bacterium]
MLVTRCPTCGTAFRAQPSQLSARGGRVRCGKCTAVFDGVANLLEEAVSAEAVEPSPQLGLFDAGAQPAGAAEEETPRVAPRRRLRRSDEPLPQFLEDEMPQPRYGFVWGLGAVVALAALAGQLAYYYRTEVATLVPRTRPYLEQACRSLACEVRLPRRPDLLSIESSDLQADARRDHLIVLNAVIRNRAPFAQELPALELTLTDAAERPVLRRVLRPAQYLPSRPAAALAQGIAPGAEEIVRVHFDTGGAPATGYRLYLFYPV